MTIHNTHSSCGVDLMVPLPLTTQKPEGTTVWGEEALLWRGLCGQDGSGKDSAL